MNCGTQPSALSQGKITVLGGNQYRPNVHICDLTRLYATLVQRNSLGSVSGRAINVGYENHTVSDIALQVKDVVDRYFNTNVPIATTASNDTRSYRLDSRLVQNELGFQFVYTIRDAVLEICEKWQSGWFINSTNVLIDPCYHNVLNMKYTDWSFNVLRSL